MFDKILALTIIIVSIYLIIISIKIIKKEVALYRKSSDREKEKIIALSLIILIPIIVFYLDYNNWFSKIFQRNFNLVEKYDWLSFAGTYLGAIVSAVFLVFITENDREENTNVIREAQRPYLDVNYMKIKNVYFKQLSEEVLVLNHGNDRDINEEKEKYLTLCIKNNGASVAIIDINKTSITLQYMDKKILKDYTFQLNTDISRLSIRSGEQIYIKFCASYLYDNRGKIKSDSRIIKSKIYYKDLFNKHYFDECELNTTLEVINDNVELNKREKD